MDLQQSVLEFPAGREIKKVWGARIFFIKMQRTDKKCKEKQGIFKHKYYCILMQ